MCRHETFYQMNKSFRVFQALAGLMLIFAIHELYHKESYGYMFMGIVGLSFILVGLISTETSEDKGNEWIVVMNVPILSIEGFLSVSSLMRQQVWQKSGFRVLFMHGYKNNFIGTRCLWEAFSG